jgi:LacI family transcriptional regulator
MKPVSTRPVTIKDVAARTGVSYKTVSRAINGEPHVSQEVREAVRQAVEELGYRPNAFARTLQGSRSSLIGLFIDDPASGYAADILSGALLRCRERSFHLLVEPVDLSQSGWPGNLDNNIKALRLDGAIVAPPLCDEPQLLAAFRSAGLPYVLLSPGRDADPAPGAVVQMDDRQAVVQMTEYLLHLGHRHIGFIKGPPIHGASARRYNAFMETMSAAHVPVRAENVMEGNFTFLSGLEAGADLLGRANRPTAVFASNDDMALGVLISALKLGITIPDSLSIAGFDDAPASQLAWPQLTTIRQPKRAMASAAVDLIVDWRRQAATGSLPATLTLDHELVIRESTGTAAH